MGLQQSTHARRPASGRKPGATAAAALGKTRTQTYVEEAIALAPVVVISKSTCPFCTQAKRALAAAGAEDPEVIELDKMDNAQAAEIQAYMGTLTGATTVPRVFVGRNFIGGGTDTAALQKSGKLAELVRAAQMQHRQELKGINAKATVKKDEAQWAKELGSAYRILRQRGTERAGSHKYDQFMPEAGHFACAGCGLPVYSASSKFKSTCGWPVFDRCYQSEEVGCHVGTRPDGSGALEIYCPRCNCHLGHVFFDAVSETNPNGERH